MLQTARATEPYGVMAGTANLAIGTRVDPRARGMHCVAGRDYLRQHTDIAVDAGGVVAARVAYRHPLEDSVVLQVIADERLRPLVVAVTRLLGSLDGYGRVDIGLEVRGTQEVRGNERKRAAWAAPDEAPQHRFGVFPANPNPHLWVGGELAVPATPDDITELVDRWTRELARAAQLPAWEPAPSAAGEDDASEDD